MSRVRNKDEPPARRLTRMLIGLMAATLAWLLPATAEAVIGARKIANNVRIKYVPPKTAAFRELHDRLTEARALEYLQQLLSPLRLPRPLVLSVSECDGVANAWYGDGSVTVCYELIHEVVREADEGARPAGLERRDTIVGPLVHIFLHEVGHAVFDLLDIPILGREEDAADQFAGYLMLQYDPGRARRLILGTAYQYRAAVRAGEVKLPTLAFSVQHGLPQQRFFNILCMAYGADDKGFAEVRNQAYVPPERLEACADEYRQVEFAFAKLIAPHVDRRLARKVRRTLIRAEGAPR